MENAFYEIKARPESSEAGGEVYYVKAESPQAALEAVQGQVGSNWIVEANPEALSDARAQELGLSEREPT